MSDPFQALKSVAADRRRGATALAVRTAGPLSALTTRREVRRAARILLRAKPAMAPLWRLCALAEESPGSPEIGRFADDLAAAQHAAATNARWLATGRKPMRIVTVSDAAAIRLSLDTLGSRVAEVRCTRSLPGGDGVRLASAMRRAGFATKVFDDTDLVRALDGADLVLTGADAIGGMLANATGTHVLAITARALGVPVYAVAASGKLLPADLVEAAAAGAFEPVPAVLLDAAITELGPLTPRQLRSRGEAVEIPETLRALAFPGVRARSG